MRPHEVENWVLQLIERIKNRQPIEDSRVELKSSWIPAEKASRQIAGHANAARGSPILWLIGIDEKTGLVGASHEELASWYAQVKGYFNGVAPALMNLNIPVHGKTVVALLFETDRAPYVVINPVYGKTGGGAVSHEAPWRENTSTRTATRAELLKILSPLQRLPVFEILEGQLMIRHELRNNEDVLGVNLNMKLYCETEGVNRVVIPFHKCQANFEIEGVAPWQGFSEISLKPPEQVNVREFSSTSMSLTIQATPDEIIINGPGKILLSCAGYIPVADCSQAGPSHVSISLRPVLSDVSASLNFSLTRGKDLPGNVARWVYR